MAEFKPEMKIEEIPYDERLWKRTFLRKPGIDFKKLKLTNIGRYSIAKSDLTKVFMKQVWSAYKLSSGKKRKMSDLIITDTNGGLGGLTIAAALKGCKVNSVEITEEHSKIIKHNAGVYGLDVNVINADYLKVMNTLSQDVIISDPPWGGTDYYKQPCLKLKFNDTNVVDIINQLHKKKAFKVFAMVAPYNFDIQNLIKLSQSYTIMVKKFRKLYVIYVIN